MSAPFSSPDPTVFDLPERERPLWMGKGRLVFERPASLRNTIFRGKLNRIGAYSYGNAETMIYSADVGRFCSFAQRVTIGPAEHPTNRLSTHGFVFGDRGVFSDLPEYDAFLSEESFAPNHERTRVGHDVWLGHGVLVRRGATIGHGAAAAAGSVVTGQIPAYALVGGAPARIIKMRFDEKTIERLLKLRWWDYQLDRSVLPDLRYSDVPRVLDQLEAAAAEGRLQPFRPPVFEIVDNEALRRIEG